MAKPSQTKKKSGDNYLPLAVVMLIGLVAAILIIAIPSPLLPLWGKALVFVYVLLFLTAIYGTISWKKWGVYLLAVLLALAHFLQLVGQTHFSTGTSGSLGLLTTDLMLFGALYNKWQYFE
jgi:hypothetical protein